MEQTEPARKQAMPLSQELRHIGRRNGREGFEVTCLGFGAAPIGSSAAAQVGANAPRQDEEAIGGVKAAHASGVRFFDTAPWYGRGVSERRLGVALSNYTRDQFRLQTKVVSDRLCPPARASHGFGGLAFSSSRLQIDIT